jgi:hypothetical protein
MEVVNAIAKSRFGSAKAQRVGIARSAAMTVELLCMEPGQQLKVEKGVWTYYVIAGACSVQCAGAEHKLGPGFCASDVPGPHVITGGEERRLICLAIGH